MPGVLFLSGVQRVLYSIVGTVIVKNQLLEMCFYDVTVWYFRHEVEKYDFSNNLFK